MSRRATPSGGKPDGSVCKVCHEGIDYMVKKRIRVYNNKLCYCIGLKSSICHRCARDYILLSPGGCSDCKMEWRDIRLIREPTTLAQFKESLGDSGCELVTWVFDFLACAAFIRFMHPYVFDLVYGTTLSAITLFVLGAIFCAIFVFLLDYMGQYAAHGLIIPVAYFINKTFQTGLPSDFEYIEPTVPSTSNRSE